MTTQTILTTVQKYLDDVEGADADTTSVLTALRLATLELSSLPIVKDRLFPQTSSTIELVEDDTEYALPSNYNYNVSRVTYDTDANIGSQVDLRPLVESDILEYQQGLGASIENYSVRGTNLIIAGTPGANEAGKVLTVHYAELPDITLIQNDSTETLLGTKYPHVLIDMAIRRFLLTEPDLAPVADRYETLVEKHKESIRQELETVTAEGPFSNELPPL
jgi:hypothetical protein